jgi:hypothetical protein
MIEPGGACLIDRARLKKVFLRSPSVSADYAAWLQLLCEGSPDQFEAYPVPAAHILALYSPRLAFLQEKSSPLAAGLSAALREIAARSSETLRGILFTASETGDGYMIWLDSNAHEIVAYFVSRSEHRSPRVNDLGSSAGAGG